MTIYNTHEIIRSSLPKKENDEARHQLPDTNKQAEEMLIEKINTYGWAALTVYSDGTVPGFAHSIGFASSLEHPEVILFGVPIEHAQTILNGIEALAKEKGPLHTSELYDKVIDEFKVCFVAVDKSRGVGYLKTCEWYYDGHCSALQLVWPDTQGHFPWEKDFDERFDRIQPMLGYPPSDIIIQR